MRARIRFVTWMMCGVVLVLPTCRADDQPAKNAPLSPEARAKLNVGLDQTIRDSDAVLKQNPKDLRALSQRGDALFFRGRFAQALRDYEAMIALDPPLDKSHWRRGLAAYYAGQWKTAADQFERCFGQDDADRENGIWRYFSQFRLHGKESARRNLLKYTQDDRPPLPAIYDLISGRNTDEHVLDTVKQAKVDGQQRQMQEFYGYLYVGIIAGLEQNRQKAEKYLRLAVSNRWAPSAGYGPRYMWQIALLEYEANLAPKGADAVPRTGRPATGSGAK